MIPMILNAFSMGSSRVSPGECRLVDSALIYSALGTPRILPALPSVGSRYLRMALVSYPLSAS